MSCNTIQKLTSVKNVYQSVSENCLKCYQAPRTSHHQIDRSSKEVSPFHQRKRSSKINSSILFSNTWSIILHSTFYYFHHHRITKIPSPPLSLYQHQHLKLPPLLPFLFFPSTYFHFPFWFYSQSANKLFTARNTKVPSKKYQLLITSSITGQ